MTAYTDMCQAFAKAVDFNAASPIPSPEGSPFDAAAMAAVVQAGAGALPKAYAISYASPLAANLGALVSQLKAEFDHDIQQGADPDQTLADVKSLTDTLVGAVRDWSAPVYAQPIRRFEAVISNLYRSFLSKEQRVKVDLPLIEVAPPLVTFAPTADSGPFTLTPETVKDLIQVPIGVVSLPGSYREHPLLWPSLAHECAGHDVSHANPGLIDELATGVAALPHLPAGMGRLWASWIDEAVADVYGLLNVGPSFAFSLAAFFSALRASQAGRKPKSLGPISNILPVSGGKPADAHPVDLLRVFLAIGATSQLVSLSANAKTRWLADLNGLAAEAAGGVTTIDVRDLDSHQVVQQLPLASMAQTAEAVGAFLVTARVAALKGHAIQDIETWDDSDETASQDIRKACNAGASLIGLGDDAQLLAGTTLAFLDDAANYAGITKLLDAALDDSFARDPVFAPPAPKFMQPRLLGLRAGKGNSRSPRFPLFPLPEGAAVA
jgi:hypothetical protein